MIGHRHDQQRAVRHPAQSRGLAGDLDDELLVGAIVGELPAGGGNGLGARLLAGSYYGQTIQIWSSLAVAAALAGALVVLVGVAERVVVGRMGARSA